MSGESPVPRPLVPGRLSVILTIHDRPAEVSRLVADSLRLPGNEPDELVVVMDRPTGPAFKGAVEAYRDVAKVVKWPALEGEPGWLCPARAWNAGFAEASGEFVYCISSDTVQAAGNVERARALIADGHTVLHGKAECSCGPEGQEVNWGGMAPGNLLGDAAHARPLGFIWAGPLAKVLGMGGFDEAFMDGLWHDDDDFFLRLWKTGVDFLFDDSVAGMHQHHERPGLAGSEGAVKISRNRALMMQKHGTTAPWASTQRRVRYGPGRTRWEHPGSTKAWTPTLTITL